MLYVIRHECGKANDPDRWRGLAGGAIKTGGITRHALAAVYADTGTGAMYGATGRPGPILTTHRMPCIGDRASAARGPPTVYACVFAMGRIVGFRPFGRQPSHSSQTRGQQCYSESFRSPLGNRILWPKVNGSATNSAFPNADSQNPDKPAEVLPATRNPLSFHRAWESHDSKCRLLPDDQ